MADLERFVAAQDDGEAGIEAALAELRAGRKRSHWIWYVFPQLAGLGGSAMSQRYGIAGRTEAEAYLRHAVLRERYARAVDAVAEHLCRLQPPRLDQVMGGPVDALKLVSSLTLFESVADGLAAREGDATWSALSDRIGEVLASAESQGYERCSFTRATLG